MGAILQELVKSSGVILFDGEKQFSTEPLEIKKQTTRVGGLENLTVWANLHQPTVPIPTSSSECLFLRLELIFSYL